MTLKMQDMDTSCTQARRQLIGHGCICAAPLVHEVPEKDRVSDVAMKKVFGLGSLFDSGFMMFLSVLQLQMALASCADAQFEAEVGMAMALSSS